MGVLTGLLGGLVGLHVGQRMIIEFTGPTGAGKTDLSGSFLSRLADLGAPGGAIHERWPNHCPLIPSHFHDVAASRLYTDIVSTLYLARRPGRHGRLAAHLVREVLCGSPDHSSHKMAILRSILRKLAIDVMLRAPRFSPWAVVIDEGVVHAAHNALVSPAARASDGAIETFVRLVPLPDIVVLVSAPPERLIERLRRRGDLSPRVGSEEELRGMVTHAHAAFAVLAAALRRRLDRTGEPASLIEIDSEDPSAGEICATLAATVATRMRRGLA